MYKLDGCRRVGVEVKIWNEQRIKARGKRLSTDERRAARVHSAGCYEVFSRDVMERGPSQATDF